MDQKKLEFLIDEYFFYVNHSIIQCNRYLDNQFMIVVAELSILSHFLGKLRLLNELFDCSNINNFSNDLEKYEKELNNIIDKSYKLGKSK